MHLTTLCVQETNHFVLLTIEGFTMQTNQDAVVLFEMYGAVTRMHTLGN